MKYKVIKLEDNKSVLVDESAEVKEGYYLDGEDIFGPFETGDILIDNKGKIIATINHSISLDVPMVIVEDEAEKLSKVKYPTIHNSEFKSDATANVLTKLCRGAFIEGHYAAQQKGVYSEEDMYMLAAKVVNDIAKNKSNADFNFFTTPKMIADEFIQSINQEYIELEMEDYLTEELALKGNFQNFRIKTNRVNGQLMAYILSKNCRIIKTLNKCGKHLMKKMYNILSPDGITIRLEHFGTKKEATSFYKEWKNRFTQQGYYSSNQGKIDLKDLDDVCEPIII